MPNIANIRSDTGVIRDANADTKVNIETLGGPTDVGVPVATSNDANPRDLPSMPNSKTRKDMDGPVPFNAKTGQTNKYQR